MAPKYKLTYFNLRARAETARLLFAAAGVEYEDFRVEFGGGPPSEQWKELKPKTPMGQLPLLEVDGVTLCQSMSIARFVARETGLDGKTSLEKAQADMIVDAVEETLNKIYATMFGTDESKAQAKKVLETAVPEFLKNMEKLAGPDGHFVGDSLTWADVRFFDLASEMMAKHADLLENFPNLTKVVDTVKANSGVAKWIAKRPETPF